MKLRYKNTTNIKVLGEIVSCKDGIIDVKTDRGVVWCYRSLAELNEDWEDYEEPKTFFTIYYDGTISEFKDGNDEQVRDMKAIGNYFSSREEAEKAVKKLKTWKRLKDKGFRFTGWTIDDGLRISICSNIDEEDIYDEDKRKMKPDLDLLFGGENE